MRRPRLGRSSWVHLAIAAATILLCAGVTIWAAGRSGTERHRLVRQQTALTGALSAAYAHIVGDRLAQMDRSPASLGFSPDCVLCITYGTATGGGPGPPRSLDLAPELAALAQAAGADTPLIALMARDGELRVLRPDGSAFTGRLLRSDAARLAWRTVVLDPFDLDARPRAVVAAPVDPDLMLVLGIDLSRRLAGVDRRHWQDGLWAVITCALLVAVAAALSVGLARQSRRQRRVADGQAGLMRLNDELRAAHDRVRTQNADLEATFAAMSDGVSCFDAELRLVRWNYRVPELTGVPPGVMRHGIHIRDVFRAQALAGEFGPFHDAAATEAEVTRRLAAFVSTTPTRVIERTRPNGQVIELRRTAQAAGGNLTIYTDVTGRKQAQAAQEAARRAAERNADEKARFAAIVSHEIRTPLHVILTALGLVDREGLPPAQRTLVETGLQAGEALLPLLNDILDLSRLESGNLPIVPAPFAPRVLVKGVAEMYRPIASQRGVRIAVTVEPGVPRQVVADGGRLRQILMNLVSNAAKYSGPGLVTLLVQAVPGVRPFLRIAVRDTGRVIAQADRARLFRPFSQLDRTSAVTTGSGLGLAICAMLAERMGGAMSVQDRSSADGVPGNEFAVTIPHAAAPPDPGGAGADTGRRLPRTRILVVEDVPANRWLLATTLRRDGHHVEVAASGQEALTRLDRTPFDVLLMDVSMPDMDGLQATRRLRARPGPSGRTAVIGVTAHVSDADRNDCLAAGMTTVLPKPVSVAGLGAAIRAHVWGGGADGPYVPDEAHPSGTFDPSRLDGLPGAGRLLQDCLGDLVSQQAALADAAARGDVGQLNATAHAMHGAAANHGFTVLAVTLKRLVSVTAVDGAVHDTVAASASDIAATRAAVARASWADMQTCRVG